MVHQPFLLSLILADVRRCGARLHGSELLDVIVGLCSGGGCCGLPGSNSDALDTLHNLPHQAKVVLV
jgi:hypothetical protein